MYIPVSILIAICNAIYSDDRACFKAAETQVSITPIFALQLGVSVRQIQDPELRKWAQNELQIRYEKSNRDIDNKGLQERYEMDTARIAGLLDEIKILQERISARDELLCAVNIELQKAKEKE